MKALVFGAPFFSGAMAYRSTVHSHKNTELSHLPASSGLELDQTATYAVIVSTVEMCEVGEPIPVRQDDI